MAPVTRSSATSPIRKDGNTSKTGKAKKSPPSPLKSAIRKRLQSPSEGTQVKFEAEDDDNAIRAHLPTTPYPSSNQLRSSSQEKLPARVPVEYSRRKEQEELLRRAARVLDARAKSAGNLPTPPQSPPGGKSSPVVKAEQSDKTAETTGQAAETTGQATESTGQAPVKNVKSTTEATSPKEKKFVIATSRHIDKIVDHIPEGLELPATIDNILIEPESGIKMEEICTAFDFLKPQIQVYCRESYSYTAPAADQVEPSFTYLKVKHLELFRYIQYVADSSQYGWDKLIKVGNQRENLVYAIISRALISHVFDAELFGASAKHNEALLEMCREYLYYDAFVRNNHRAEMIKSILLNEAKNNSTAENSPYTYFQDAISLIERRIDVLLQPLRVADPESPSIQPKESLHSILQTALKIHLAIRLAGANGTVYRFQDPHTLSPWDANNMNCVNQRKMDLSVHHGEEPLVKISCFPAAFATVPSGPNLEQFTNADFVEKWKNTADPDEEEGKGKPVITQYPITLADVVLENTPMVDRSGFVTLDQTMQREQQAMSDKELLTLTGINRKTIRRVSKFVNGAHMIAKHTRRAAKGVSVGLATAAASWYLYHIREQITPVLSGLLEQAPQLLSKSLVKATAKPTVVVVRPKTVMTLTPESLLTRTRAAYVTPARMVG
jgi:hypothetical protein